MAAKESRDTRSTMTGAQFKAIRLALGMSRAQLSRRIGLYQGTIAAIEWGREGYGVTKPVAELMLMLERYEKPAAPPAKKAKGPKARNIASTKGPPAT